MEALLVEALLELLLASLMMDDSKDNIKAIIVIDNLACVQVNATVGCNVGPLHRCAVGYYKASYIR